MNNQVTVIIPTMNRVDTLKDTLDSYIQGDLLPDQVVIVDQTQDLNLRNKIKQLVESYCYNVNVTYQYQDNPSLTQARNLGVKLAINNVLVFSDDDVTVQYNTIQNVKNIMQDESISMIAGINSRDKISNSKMGYIFGKKSYKKRKIGYVTKSMLGRFPENQVKGTVETEWAMGFFFVVRKSLIEKWDNYWDTNLTSYAYAEDLDFSYSYWKHSQNAHYKCILDDRIVVEHRVSTEWRVPSKKSTMMYVLNREYLSYKHKMGWKSRVLMRWCDIGELLMRYAKNSQAQDLIAAQKSRREHKEEISKGILKPEWYNK